MGPYDLKPSLYKKSKKTIKAIGNQLYDYKLTIAMTGILIYYQRYVPLSASTDENTTLSSTIHMRIGKLSHTIGSFCLSTLRSITPSAATIKSSLSSLEKIDELLPEQIKNNPNFYSPLFSSIIGAVVTSASSLLIEGARYYYLQSAQRSENHRLKEIHEIGELARSGQQNLVHGDYYAALSAYRIARIKYDPMLFGDEYNEKLLTWSELALNEARSLFFLGKFNNENEEHAGQVLQNILRKNPSCVDAINLYGFILLQHGAVSHAENEFLLSLKLNPTQTSIYSLWAFCKGNYMDAIKYIDEHDYDTLWSHHVLHILLFSQGQAYYQLALLDDNEKTNYLIKSIEQLEAAEAAVPKNSAFEAARSSNLEHLHVALLDLGNLIANSQSITVKTLFPHHRKELINIQENQSIYLQQQATILNMQGSQSKETASSSRRDAVQNTCSRQTQQIQSYIMDKQPMLQQIYDAMGLQARADKILSLTKTLACKPATFVGEGTEDTIKKDRMSKMELTSKNKKITLVT